MEDEQFKTRVIETLAKHSVRLEDVHQATKDLTKLPERMSLIEQENDQLFKGLKAIDAKVDKIDKKLGDHIAHDEDKQEQIAKWLIRLTFGVGLLMVIVMGGDKTVKWIMTLI